MPQHPNDMSAERNTTRLLVGHGSRSAVAQAEFAAFVAAYQEHHPQDYVECAHLELAEPRLPAALAAAAQRSRRVVVLPLFLFAAGHVKMIFRSRSRSVNGTSPVWNL